MKGGGRKRKGRKGREGEGRGMKGNEGEVRTVGQSSSNANA